MKWQRTKEGELEISMTPLIDVVFLLLIFFMISTTFKDDAEISIELPHASAQPKEQEQSPITLTIDASGHYYIDQKRLVNDAEGTLLRVLRQVLAKGTPKTAGMIINADGQTTHQSVVTAMDVARQLGIVRISLATSPPKHD